MKKRLLIGLTVFVLVVGILTYALAADGKLSGNIFSSLLPQNTVTITQEEYERYQKYEKIEEIYEYLVNYYYIEPDEDAMMEWAINGMMAALDDPYTFYYNEEAWAELWESDEGEYAGIGIQLLINYSTDIVTISRVFKDTPAENAGLRRGDVLKRVDDLEVTSTTASEAVDIMRGHVDEIAEIEVERKGETIVFQIPRAEIKVNWIESTMLENDVGYICLYEFAGDCDTAFSEALANLEAEGAKALIIDLRDNGGGWVDAALSIADHFLDEQVFFYAEDRAGVRETYNTKDGKDDIPLVVLVNEGSASSSEILSGGLQDAGRATLVGTKTYGKGIMQNVVTLSGGTDGIQFTVMQYYMPSGKAVHKIGITPDIEEAMPDEYVGAYFELGDMTDPQLHRAWEEAVKLLENAGEEEAADNASAA